MSTLVIQGEGRAMRVQNCSPEAGIRPIGTMMTGLAIAITTTGIGVTGGAAGMTRTGIPGTDPPTKAPAAGLISAPRRLRLRDDTCSLGSLVFRDPLGVKYLVLGGRAGIEPRDFFGVNAN